MDTDNFPLIPRFTLKETLWIIAGLVALWIIAVGVLSF